MVSVHPKTNSDASGQCFLPFAEKQTESNISEETHGHTGSSCPSSVDSSVLFSASKLLNINNGC